MHYVETRQFGRGFIFYWAMIPIILTEIEFT